MYYFYVLYSLKDHRLYKGYSANVAERFIKHQNGATTSTRHRRPLILIYLEEFTTKAEALQRERWAKSLEGGTSLRLLLQTANILGVDGKLKMD